MLSKIFSSNAPSDRPTSYPRQTTTSTHALCRRHPLPNLWPLHPSSSSNDPSPILSNRSYHIHYSHYTHYTCYTYYSEPPRLKLCCRIHGTCSSRDPHYTHYTCYPYYSEPPRLKLCGPRNTHYTHYTC